MSYEVSVRYPKNDPFLAGMPAREVIASMASCPGNIAMAPEALGLKRLPHLETREQCIEALGLVIRELDKGNDGVFNDQWCVEADKRWSGGRESTSEWERAEPVVHHLPESYQTYEGYTGQSKRNQLMEDAQRFYLYYRAGMDVSFEW